MKDLTERAMLVNLNISQWSAKKHDAKVTKEIEEQHQSHHAGVFQKQLIEKSELKNIQKVVGNIRTFHYFNTLPWGDNGDRILPAENYLKYVTQLGELKREFEKAVNAFIASYQELKKQSMERLNGLYNELDYPKESDLLDKFSIKVSFMPIENAKDFRVAIDPEEAKAVKQHIENEISERIAKSTENIINRMKDAVTHLFDKLSDKDAIFRDTLITNIEELVNVLPSLNYNDDPKIADLIDDMKKLCTDPNVLRTNETVRSTKAQEAQEILDKMKGFF